MAGMKDATVRQLQIFDAAARALSFSRAAEALHLTQPAVSMQIRQLEHFAGVPLFERTGRRLHLTDAGEALVLHARAVLRALEEADERFAAMKGLHGGRVRLAVVSTAKYFAPRLIARFAQAHPGVEVRLQVDNRQDVVKTLAANDVDLALMGRPPGELDLKAAPFADHPHVIIAPPDHPLAHRRRVDIDALAAETFLVREAGSGTRGAASARPCTGRVTVFASQNEPLMASSSDRPVITYRKLRTRRYEAAATDSESCITT